MLLLLYLSCHFFTFALVSFAFRDEV